MIFGSKILIHYQECLLPTQFPSFLHKYWQYIGIFSWQLTRYSNYSANSFTELCTLFPIPHLFLNSEPYTCTSDSVHFDFHSEECFP